MTLKKKILKTVMPVGLAAATALTAAGCKDAVSNAPQPVKQTQKVSARPKDPAREHLLATYQALQSLDGQFSYYPRKGVFQDKPTVLIGFGTPISEADFVSLRSSFDGLGRKNVPAIKRMIYKHLLEPIPGLPDRVLEEFANFRIENNAIRSYTLSYLRKNIPEVEKLVPDFAQKPAAVRAALMDVYTRTGGKLASYTNLVKAANALSLPVSENEEAWRQFINNMDISTGTFAKVNPTIDPQQGVREQTNKDRRQALELVMRGLTTPRTVVWSRDQGGRR